MNGKRDCPVPIHLPLFYYPPDGTYRIQLDAQRIAALDYVSRRHHAVNEGPMEVLLVRGRVEPGVRRVSCYPIQSGATAEDRERQLKQLKDRQ